MSELPRSILFFLKGMPKYGVSDKRWTNADQRSQYRRIITIMKKEKHVLTCNKKRADECAAADFNLLKNETKDLARRLHKAKQESKLDTGALASHRDILLPYCKLSPESVIEHIDQKVFNLRKTKDRLSCVKSKLIKQFKEAMEDQSFVNDRLELERAGFKNESERSLQLLSCAVQAQRIRNNAILTVRNAYRAAVQIMTKESIYYDTLTTLLEQDLKVQNSMLLLAILIGQMAVETKEELKSEYENLEQFTRQSMAVRQRDLTLMKHESDLFKKHLKTMVREDADIWLQSTKDISKTEGYNGLEEDREFLHDLIEQIQTFTMVSTADDILPRFEDQLQKYIFLCFLRDHLTFKCDNVLMQLNHADLQLTIAIYSFDKERALHLVNKQELLDAIELQKQRKIKYNDEMLLCGNLFTLIRGILRNLVDSMAQVQVGNGEKQPDVLNREESNVTRPPLTTQTNKILVTSSADKSLQLLDSAMHKLRTLIEVFHDLEPESKRKAQSLYIAVRTEQPLASYSTVELDLLEGLDFIDHDVPTNKSVKMESEEIVEDNIVLPFT